MSKGVEACMKLAATQTRHIRNVMEQPLIIPMLQRLGASSFQTEHSELVRLRQEIDIILNSLPRVDEARVNYDQMACSVVQVRSLCVQAKLAVAELVAGRCSYPVLSRPRGATCTSLSTPFNVGKRG